MSSPKGSATHDAAKGSPPSAKEDSPESTSEVHHSQNDNTPLHVQHIENDDNSTEGLITHRTKRVSFLQHTRQDWLRPYWLGLGLFMILFAFWLLDSLKDPVFAVLVDGNLDRHQPPAKLCSVCSTLALVCLLEFLSHARRQQQEEQEQNSDQHVLDPGGRWTRMGMGRQEQDADDRVPVSIFAYVGSAYICVFCLLAFVLRYHPSISGSDDDSSGSSAPWHVLGYILYATVESFGSLSVATFWSYSNSTLSLQDAESFYGLIIAIAQLGAIGGSSMVTTHYWSEVTLILVACLVIVLEIVVMMSYARRFPPTAQEEPVHTTQQEPVFWSGIYLILRHNYVLLILGVSCLYEVSLTCLDYQLKLLGWYKFEQDAASKMTFTKFMGRYGQLTNVTSLFFSYFAFPYLIHKCGLRITLRLFPTLLCLVTVVAYGAIPGNLAVLFVSMAVLKAMTYSIHDPSKEILYLPTSNAIKFRAKFWIDVVGARVAKAVGSSINTYAGSVDRSVRVGSVPSLLTAAALWIVCYRAGIQFDGLVRNGTVVGMDASHETTTTTHSEGYAKVKTHAEDLEAEQSGLLKDDMEEEDPTGDISNVELTPLR